MAAKSLWDVLWSGLMITAGGCSAISSSKCGVEKARWYRAIGWLVSSVGWMCCGLSWLTRGGTVFLPMALFGQLIGTGVFGDAKLSTLFPTLFGRR